MEFIVASLPSLLYQKRNYLVSSLISIDQLLRAMSLFPDFRSAMFDLWKSRDQYLLSWISEFLDKIQMGLRSMKMENDVFIWKYDTKGSKDVHDINTFDFYREFDYKKSWQALFRDIKLIRELWYSFVSGRSFSKPSLHFNDDADSLYDRVVKIFLQDKKIWIRGRVKKILSSHICLVESISNPDQKFELNILLMPFAIVK